MCQAGDWLEQQRHCSWQHIQLWESISLAGGKPSDLCKVSLQNQSYCLKYAKHIRSKKSSIVTSHQYRHRRRRRRIIIMYVSLSEFHKKLSYLPLRNRASAMHFLVAQLFSIAVTTETSVTSETYVRWTGWLQQQHVSPDHTFVWRLLSRERRRISA